MLCKKWTQLLTVYHNITCMSFAFSLCFPILADIHPQDAHFVILWLVLISVHPQNLSPPFSVLLTVKISQEEGFMAFIQNNIVTNGSTHSTTTSTVSTVTFPLEFIHQVICFLSNSLCSILGGSCPFSGEFLWFHYHLLKCIKGTLETGKQFRLLTEGQSNHAICSRRQLIWTNKWEVLAVIRILNLIYRNVLLVKRSPMQIPCNRHYWIFSKNGSYHIFKVLCHLFLCNFSFVLFWHWSVPLFPHWDLVQATIPIIFLNWALHSKQMLKLKFEHSQDP